MGNTERKSELESVTKKVRKTVDYFVVHGQKDTAPVDNTKGDEITCAWMKCHHRV